MKILQYPGVRISACKTCYYKGITFNKIYSFSKLFSSKKGSAMTESYQEILQLFHMKLRAETGAKTCKTLFFFFFRKLSKSTRWRRYYQGKHVRVRTRLCGENWKKKGHNAFFYTLSMDWKRETVYTKATTTWKIVPDTAISCHSHVAFQKKKC